MVIGKLPFTTPYTDQYRRQKLLQQVEKGITEPQLKEMCHLSEGEGGQRGLTVRFYSIVAFWSCYYTIQ